MNLGFSQPIFEKAPNIKFD